VHIDFNVRIELVAAGVSHYYRKLSVSPFWIGNRQSVGKKLDLICGGGKIEGLISLS